MPRSKVRTIYGIHSVTLYRPESGEFYGTLECLEGSNLSMSGESVELTGGSSKFPFAVADGVINTEVSFTPSEYPNFLFEVLLGKKPDALEGTGKIDFLLEKEEVFKDDKKSEIISITSHKSDNLKFGKYFLNVSDKKVSLHASSSADFARGDSVDYKEDDLTVWSKTIEAKKPSPGPENINEDTDTADNGAEKPNVNPNSETENPNTNSSPDAETPNANTHIIDELGLTIEVLKPSEFTNEYSCSFSVRPNKKGMEVTVGGTSDVYPEFGAILVAENQSGSLLEIDCFRLKAAGLPIGMTKKTFSNAEITAKAMYSPEHSGVFKVTAID